MQETYTHTPDNLFAGTQVQPVVADAVVIRAGSAPLNRGAALGQITSNNAGTPTADGGNAGNGTITGISVSNDALTGTYTVTITAAAGGGDPAEFELEDPQGNTAEGVAGTALTALGITLTVNDGLTPFEVGDLFTIAVTEGKGEFILCDSTAIDGSQTLVCILAEDTDASEGDRPAPAYFTGEFNQAAITFGGTDTYATHKDAARKIGIFLKPVEAV